jgi:hypothetical protein
VEVVVDEAGADGLRLIKKTTDATTTMTTITPAIIA